MCLLLHREPENGTSKPSATARPCKLHHTLCSAKTLPMCRQKASSRDARRNNKRPLELLAAAAEINQAVRLAANPLRRRAPQFRSVVQWYEGDAHGSGNWGVTYRRYVDGFVKAAGTRFANRGRRMF